MTRERKVLGVGSALVDVLARVEDDFLARHIPGAKGGMEMVEAQWQQSLLTNFPEAPAWVPGGAAGNTVFGLANFSMPVAMYSKVGRDEHGRFYRRSLVELGGFDDEFVETDEAATGCCVSLITPDTERTMRSYLGASQLSTVENIDAIDFSRYEIVYIEGYLLFLDGVVERVMQRAKAAGCKVALDMASFEVVKIFRDTLIPMLQEYVDLAFANEDEAAALFGEELSEEEMARKLGAWCEVAVVKRGRRGSVIAFGEELHEVEPQLVTAIDTTGAGDLWASGFLYGYLQGKALPECGRIGSIVAAEVVQVIGAKISPEGWVRIRSAIA